MIKPKPKVCPYCKEEYTPFNSLQKCPKIGCRKTNENKNPRKRMNPISEKLKQERKSYNQIKELWLVGKICPVTGRPAEQVHHIDKRNGSRLNDIKNWLAVTQEGHLWIHSFPNEARLKGWLK
jgi:hypothetical protein